MGSIPDFAVPTEDAILLDTMLETCRCNRKLDAKMMTGANTEQTDCDGCTPLYWAILHDNAHNVSLLLDHGASLDVAPGTNAFYHAVTFNSIKSFRLLQTHASPEQYEDGLPLIIYAKRLGRDEISYAMHPL